MGHSLTRARHGTRWAPPLLIGIALSAIAWRPDSAEDAEALALFRPVRWPSRVPRRPPAERADAPNCSALLCNGQKNRIY